MIRLIAAALTALLLAYGPAAAQVQPSSPVASKTYVDTSAQILLNAVSGKFDKSGGTLTGPLNGTSGSFTGAVTAGTLVGDGSVGVTVLGRTLQARAQDTISVKDKPFNAKGDGVTDDTAALAAALSYGGSITIPAGNYLIAGTAPSTDGVVVDWKRPTRVDASPDARIFSNGLDGILVRFERNVPAIQAGVRLSLDWTGGVFDISKSKLSTSHPFVGAGFTFGGVQGTADVTDALYTHGSYQPSSGAPYQNGATRISVRGAVFYGGPHWQNAGGDSGVYPEGADIMSVEDSKFIGINDAGIYVSQSVDGTTSGRVSVRNNTFINNAGAVAIKRGPTGFVVEGNTFINSARGVVIEWLVGQNPKAGTIRDNRCVNCGALARLYYSRYVTIADNVTENTGAFLADGTTIVPDQIAGVYLFGSSFTTITNNRGVGVDASHYDTSAFFVRTTTYTVNGTTYDSNNNRVEGNQSDGWYDFATDVGGSSNRYWWNAVSNSGAATSGVTAASATSTVLALSGSSPLFSSPALFANGSAGVPALARAQQPNTGIYFGTSLVGFSVNGNATFQANSTNIIPSKNFVPAGNGSLANGGPSNLWSNVYSTNLNLGAAANTITYGAAIPTTGTWLKGDKVINNAPAVGSPKGWVCTVAGSPGTWVSEGNL